MTCKYKKIIVWILLAALCIMRPVFFLCVSAAESVDSDTENAFHLSSPEDLSELSRNCVLDTWSPDKVVVLDCDIDLKDTDFDPVPTFGGVFLGNGHTVSGFALEGGSDYTGFFRYIQETGAVYDLKLSGTAQAESSQEGLALLAGRNYGLISGCTASGSVTGGNSVGMLAGSNEMTGVITDCLSEGFVYGNHVAGGIAGANRGSILNGRSRCHVNTVVSDTELDLSALTIRNIFTTENAASVTDIGGIAGSNSGVIRSCTNDGAVGYQHVGYNIGGIAGSQTGYIEGCINYGVLNGRKDVGGIAGQMEPSSEFEFSQDTLDRLHTEFNRLHDMITQLLNDTKDASDNLTEQVEHLLSSVENTQRAIDAIAGQAGADMDAFSRLTDLSALPTPHPVSLDFLDKLPSVSAAPSPTPEDTSSPVPEDTPTPSPSETPESTPTSLPEESPEASPSEMPERTHSRTEEPTPGQTPEAIPEGSPELTVDSQPEGGLSRETFQTEKRMAGPALVVPSVLHLSELHSFAQQLPADLPLEEPAASPDQSPEPPEPLPSPDQSPELPEPLPSPGQSPELPEPLPSPSGTPGLPIPLPSVSAGLPVALPSGLDFDFDREAAENEINKMQDNLYDGASSVLEKVNDLINSRSSMISARIAAAQQSLSGSFSGILTDMRVLNTLLREENRTLVSDFQAIADQMNVIGNIITDPETTDPDDIIVDVSDEDETFDTTGKVMNCVNRGKIYGDLNVGGIAGSLSRENNLDPEDDLSVDRDLATLNFRYKERIVIRESSNSGVITGKKDCVGGIAGNMTLGSIIDCIGSGDVKGEGNMVGGIAGLSQASIRGSSAKCMLSGRDQVGGIAGCGKAISGCFSMVEIQEGGSYLGSVAGKAEVLDEITDNYFVEGCPAGIDGISYSKAAAPLPYKEFMTLENLPDIYKNIYLTFMAEDQIVSTVTLSYGESFDVNRLPQVPPKEGFFAQWEDFDPSSLTFDRTINALYSEYITTLESTQREENRPIALVEGIFEPGDSFILSDIQAYPEDAATLARCHKLSISGGTAPYTVRYLIPPDMKKPQIEFFENNTWVPAAAERDGSYYIFHTDQPELVFSCVDRPSSFMDAAMPVMAVLLAALLLSVLWIIRRRKKNAR